MMSDEVTHVLASTVWNAYVRFLSSSPLAGLRVQRPPTRATIKIYPACVLSFFSFHPKLKAFSQSQIHVYLIKIVPSGSTSNAPTMFFGNRSDNLVLLLYSILAIRWFGFSFGRSRDDRLPERRELQVQTEHTTPFHSWWRDYFSSNETYQQNQAEYGQSISLSDEPDMPGNNESLTSCIPQPNQPLAKVRIRVHADDDDQLEVDGKKKSKIKRAVCEFICHGRQVHFPHAMQQLYRCYSLWMDHPQAKAILLVSDEEIQR